MDEEIYLSIDRYMANEMGADEKREFEERLQQDKNLTEKLDIYRSAMEALSSKFQREEKENLFKQNIATIAAKYDAPVSNKVIKLNWYAWAAAACIALLCVVLFYTMSSKPDYNQFAHYGSIALVERGDRDTLKLQAQEAFNNRHYEKAIVLFNQLLQNDSNTELELYKGIALLELNKINDAEELFYKIKKSGSIYSSKATWMLALSALKQKDYKKCESLLKQIPTDTEEYNDAQLLLKKL